jgi:hypothetical protein
MNLPKPAIYFLFILIIGFSNSYCQTNTYKNYKISEGKIEGFATVNPESLSKIIIKAIQKESGKVISRDNGVIEYYKNDSGLVCAFFQTKNYEGEFIFINNSGKCIQKMICLNAEFQEYYKIYEQAIEIIPTLKYLEYPFSPIVKNITDEKTWYEAFSEKQEGEEFWKIVIYNKDFKQVAIEEYL